MLLSGEMLSMLTYSPVLLSIYAAAVADGVSTLHERYQLGGLLEVGCA